jgi:DNA repair protein RadC
MLVRDLNPDERPMARLEKHGPETLSDSELLSILFGGQTSLRAARYALRNGLSNLPKSLKDPKIAPVRKARVAAFLELARRFASGPESSAKQLFTADSTARQLMLRLGRKESEHCGVVLLDSRLQIIGEQDLFVGTINNTIVAPRDIIKAALLANATGIVVYHNHPSGDPTPSREDLVMTAKLKAAASTMSIELVDHLIVGRSRYYSLAAHGHL